jgi:hypothetical protein
MAVIAAHSARVAAWIRTKEDIDGIVMVADRDPWNAEAAPIPFCSIGAAPRQK